MIRVNVMVIGAMILNVHNARMKQNATKKNPNQHPCDVNRSIKKWHKKFIAMQNKISEWKQINVNQ